jgi:hypothetical protein
MTKIQFVEAMAFLESALGRKLSADEARARFVFVEDLPAEALKFAVIKHIGGALEPWLPTIGELRTLAVDWLKDTHWRELWRVIDAIGFDEEKVKAKLSPLTRAAVDDMSWWRITRERYAMETDFRREIGLRLFKKTPASLGIEGSRRDEVAALASPEARSLAKARPAITNSESQHRKELIR